MKIISLSYFICLWTTCWHRLAQRSDSADLMLKRTMTRVDQSLVGGFNPSDPVGVTIPSIWKIIKFMFQTIKAENRLHLLSPLVVSVFGDHGSTPSHDMAKSRAVTSLCSPKDTRPQLILFSMGSSSLKFPRHAVSCFVVSCLKFRSLNTFLSVIN